MKTVTKNEADTAMHQQSTLAELQEEFHGQLTTHWEEVEVAERDTVGGSKAFLGDGAFSLDGIFSTQLHGNQPNFP